MTPNTCANCGAPLDEGALFCSRCGLNLTKEYRATPIGSVAPQEVSDTFVKLRESLGSRYGIERELGRGGMATVFLARDLKHDREVAIKVLHPDLAATIGGERFEREIKVAAKISHPHILALYDSGEADGLLYYVMPFVKGESLRDRLDREKMLPVEDAVRITLEVASALGYAHEQGIVHRDIKPENILLAGDHALVADFGIARAASEAGQQKLTQTGMAVGTPVYMAPEQSSGDTVGPTADIYSLGCMLYEMLAGEPPFNGPNAMAIMAKHLMEQPPSIRVVRQAVPEEIEEAILIALNKTPVDRPQTAQQFAELLSGMFGATSTMRVMNARRTPTPRYSSLGVPQLPLEPWYRRPIGLATAAAVVVLAAAGVWFATQRGPRGTAVLGEEARRLAVLPFGDLSRDSSLAPVADALTDGLIQTLSTSPSITVISRAGVEPFRGAGVAVDSIARALRVGFLVRGDVEPSGNRVQVALRLDDASGVRLQSASFALSRDSIFQLEDSLGTIAADLIRRQLGEELRVQLQRAATTSQDAWLLTQRALQQQRAMQDAYRRGEPDAAARAYAAADSILAVSEELDASWSRPTAMRAMLAYLRSRTVGGDQSAIRSLVEAGIAHADRALTRNANDADALEARGTLRFWSYIALPYSSAAEKDRVLLAAQADLERATALNRNQAGAYATLAAAYSAIPGKTTSDIYLAAVRAFEADEFLEGANLNFSRAFNAQYDLGNAAAAKEWCDRFSRRFPMDPRALRCRLYVMTMPSAPDVSIPRAWALVDSIVERTPPRDSLRTRLWMRILAAGAVARAAETNPTLADSARRVVLASQGDATVDPNRELPYFGAFVLAITGDGDGTVRLLREYIAANPQRALALRDDPGWWFRGVADREDYRRLVGAPR